MLNGTISGARDFWVSTTVSKKASRREFLPLGAKQGALGEGEVLHHQETGLGNMCYVILSRRIGLYGRVQDSMWATQCDSSQAALIPWQQGAECVMPLLAALPGYPKGSGFSQSSRYGLERFATQQQIKTIMLLSPATTQLACAPGVGCA